MLLFPCSATLDPKIHNQQKEIAKQKNGLPQLKPAAKDRRYAGKKSYMPYCATDMPTDKEAKIIKSFIPFMSYLQALFAFFHVLHSNYFNEEKKTFVFVVDFSGQSVVS